MNNYTATIIALALSNVTFTNSSSLQFARRLCDNIVTSAQTSDSLKVKTQSKAKQIKRKKSVTQSIVVDFAHNSIFGGSYGKKDGIRIGDRLIVVRRDAAGLIITGYGKVYEVTKDAFDASSRTQNFRIGDEAFIVSRDDSPYSLMNQDNSVFAPLRQPNR